MPPNNASHCELAARREGFYLSGAHNRIMEAEVADRAMQDYVDAGAHHQLQDESVLAAAQRVQ